MYMQQQALNFTVQDVQAQVSLAERMRRIGQRVNNWLDARSAFYSRIAEFDVTRRVVVRVNLVGVAIAVTAVCVEQEPVVSVAAMAAAAWMVYRLNHTSEKGGQA